MQILIKCAILTICVDYGKSCGFLKNPGDFDNSRGFWQNLQISTISVDFGKLCGFFTIRADFGKACRFFKNPAYVDNLGGFWQIVQIFKKQPSH